MEQADLDHERRLRVLADVTCDVTGPTNMLPVNTEHHHVGGTGPAAARWRSGDGPAAMEVIAIDNLPSLLPREASEGFSADLAPHLLGLAGDDGPSAPWHAAAPAFDQAIAELGTP